MVYYIQYTQGCFMRIGIDIGSTTVKTVVLSKSGELLFSVYERHFSKVREKAAEQLRKAAGLFEQTPHAAVAITGSAGLGVAKTTGLPFVQEVYATAAIVRERAPQTDAVIELGGEDAKIIFFGGSIEERMNGSCAGGTGSFIDQMATLLAVTVPELNELSLRHSKIYPIASRCGVFAKSDIQAILNQGGRHEDIAASIFQAVVDQTVGGLTQGRELIGNIMFLGGPLTFLQGLKNRFIESLELDESSAIFPEHAEYFPAIGAAMCADEKSALPFEQILSSLEHAIGDVQTRDKHLPLFDSKEQYDAFCSRHAAAAPSDVDANTYSGPAYLGIDAGSTTTKLALITPQGAILYSYYSGNKGNPVSIILEQLKKIYEIFGDRITIRGSAVTGYGEDLIKSAFNIDFGLVETMAHLRAASFFEPEVDFIIDIGGQDVKCFKIYDGAVDSIMLNEACSSGCGSFIETFAVALGYNISDFSKLGLFANEPPDLGSRCTVFMNSSVKQAQKDGAPVEAISAGLSISIVKNAVYKVIRAVNADDLGKHIVVQGGTFLNDAVLRAFERELNANVTRPAISELMGAYGAALSAMDFSLSESKLLKMDALNNFTHNVEPVTCKACTNNCSMTVNRFDGGRLLISGNRCSKPLGINASKEPNLIKYKYDKLRGYCGNGTGTGARGKIGIPFGLNMVELLPFWFSFFTTLDYEVVLSEKSSRQLYTRGQRTIPSDTVCYPAKLVHGQIESLLDMGVSNIFMPCMPYNFDEGISDNHYNCPVAAYYPELLLANMPRLKDKNFMIPYFGLQNRRGFVKKATEYFRKINISSGEIKKAAVAAYSSYTEFMVELESRAVEYIKYAQDNDKQIIVIAGRPYHVDPEVHHGVDELIGSLGLVLITDDSIAKQLGKESRKVLNQWTYQARMYNAARVALEHDNMHLVQLVSFGCGTDAITSDELRDIMESGGKLYTQLKIDDISNLGAARIRLRTLVAAIEARAARSKCSK